MALDVVRHALPVVLQQPKDVERRDQMLRASLFAGLAISQTRTAIAHSISYPLTVHYGVPHGLACSFTLPELLRGNIDKLTRHRPERSVLSAVLRLLEGFELAERVRPYASGDEILALQGEMKTPERADNYVFPVDIEGVLEGSL